MRRFVGYCLAALSVLLLGGVLAGTASAQELEPRAYSPSPVGANFVVVAYGYQSGDVFVDPTLPIEDIEVKLNTGSIGYSRTFGLAGRQSSITVVLPYVIGNVSGTVFEQSREIERFGGADLRMRFAMNILGGAAMTRKEFAARKPATTLGASIVVIAPTGQYDPERLINIGSNRWSFKPELGVYKPHGRWTFEGSTGVWFFTTNGAFYGGTEYSQKPLATLQGNVSYTIRPRLWVAGGATFFAGGRTAVGGVEKDTFQKNSRFGVQASVPVGARQSLKFSYVHGLTTRIGGKLDSFGVAWQYTWF
jgi:hypothetical protein